MNVLYLSADNALEMNCSHWRCVMPCEAINLQGKHHAKVVQILAWARGEHEAESAWADVIVVQRNAFVPQVQQRAMAWKVRGKTVIVDFDDAYDLMPRSNVAYKFWQQGIMTVDGKEQTSPDKPVDLFARALPLFHAATMPSKVLVEDWADVLPCYYVPNYLPASYFRNLTRLPHDGIWIGWGGSMSHRQSWMNSGLMAACQRVARERPDVQFHIHSADEAIYHLLPVPERQKVLTPWMDYGSWAQQLAQFDIGLAPLWGAYDDRRSWIKPMEYMLAGVRYVASRSRAYEELLGYGTHCANTAKAWEEALLFALDTPNLQRLTGAERFAWAADVDLNVDKIIETYQTITEKHAA